MRCMDYFLAGADSSHHDQLPGDVQTFARRGLNPPGAI
jgi:hypothetical protein